MGGYNLRSLRFHCRCCPARNASARNAAAVVLSALVESADAGDIPAVEALSIAQRASVSAAANKALATTRSLLPCQGVLQSMLTLCSEHVTRIPVSESLVPPSDSQHRSTSSHAASFGAWIEALDAATLRKHTTLQTYTSFWQELCPASHDYTLRAVMLRNVISWRCLGVSYGTVTLMHEVVNSRPTMVIHSECHCPYGSARQAGHELFCPHSLQVFRDLLRGDLPILVCIVTSKQLQRLTWHFLIRVLLWSMRNVSSVCL